MAELAILNNNYPAFLQHSTSSVERNEERQAHTDLKQKLWVADTEVAHFHHRVILKKKKYKKYGVQNVSDN